MQQRILWIDNLKGFILLLVCISHLDILLDLCDYLKGGRMTTFFFLSGILFSTRKYPTFTSFFKSKCHSLIIPYFILSFLFAFFPCQLKDDQIFASEWIQNFNLPITIEKYITTYIISTIDIIQGYSFQQGTGPLWFVYTLFQVSILYYLINRLRNTYFKTSLLIISLCLGWYCNMHSIVLPLHMNTMFTSLFFFGIGKYYNDYCMEKISYNKMKLYIIPCIILYSIAYYNGGRIDLAYNKLGSSLFIFLLYTISGIFLFISIFRFISKKDNIVFGIFRNISRNALIILCVHFFYAIWFDELFIANIYYKILFVIVCTIISIPIFRCYLYKLIGKEKISIKESLSIK